MTHEVMTVRGPVAASALGFTLPHEHVVLDLVKAFPTQLLAFDFMLVDEELAVDELRRFAAAASEFPGAAGARPSVVDVTVDDRMGRNPDALRRIGEALDVHIVMGCGRYREPWYEPEFSRLKTGDLVDLLVAEIEHGVGDTGIRPGIIGELGADRDFVTPAEERVLRAAARAHLRTGLPITLHARASRVGLDQLDILVEEGVHPGRVIVGHSDTNPDPAYHAEIAGRGAWVQFDTIRGRYEHVVERRLRYIRQARNGGYLGRVLLSQDVCAQSHLHAYGGTGYDYLPAEFTQLLRDSGLADDDLSALFVEHPRLALTPALQ